MSGSLTKLLKANRNFRCLTLAFAISLLGDWFSTIAVFSLLSGSSAHQASLIGGVLIVKQLPLFLFSIPAGVIADRISRRRIMVLADLSRAVVVIALLLYPLVGSAWYVYLLLALQAALSAFFEPARSALTPDLVESHDLVNANALHSMLWSVMLVLGAALGGFVTELLGWELAIVLDAFSYLVSAWFIRQIVYPQRSIPAKRVDQAPSTSWGDIKSFLQFLAQNPRVKVLCILKGVYGIGGAMILLLTVFGQEVYALGETGALGVSVLYAARGLGALCGPLIARAISRGEQRRMRKLVYYSFLLIGFSYACFGLSTNIWLACFFVALAHMMGSSIWVLSTILLQLNVPAELRGRAFGMELGVFTLVFSCSTLLYGWLIDASHLSPRLACVILGLSWFVSALWWLYNQRMWKGDETL